MAQTRKSRSGLRPLLRRAFYICVVLAAIPTIFTFFYLPSFVHPISTLMMKDLVTFKGYDRQWVALDDVAPVLVRSVVMSEDGQFCWHRGIDWAELKGVIDDAVAGEMTRGASTITMQTVKNLYLWHRPLGTVRKVIELPSPSISTVMSKKRIMEIYLNIAEWGPGIYGIEAAAQHLFGDRRILNAKQAALLAVTLPNPISRPGQSVARPIRFFSRPDASPRRQPMCSASSGKGKNRPCAGQTPVARV